jgi:CubicO group peptidase (beta-lactamase class C family)
MPPGQYWKSPVVVDGTGQRVLRKEPADPFEGAHRLMTEAVAGGVFPGAVLLAARGGRVLCHRAYGVTDLGTGQRVTVDTVFDLASLTKPLATTPALICLMADGRLTPESSLEGLLPEFQGQPAARVTVAQLLRHTSGLPAWEPYFERLRQLPAGQRWPWLRHRLSRTPLEAPPGAQTVYSDLNFMILGWVVETIAGLGLDRFVTQRVYRPLGIDSLYFIDHAHPVPPASYAATERCPWRGLLRGRVHDDNCDALGGVCGHAGLFGTAAAVYRLLLAIRGAYRGQGAGGVLAPRWVRTFLDPAADGRRPMGFDHPSGPMPSYGHRFSPRTVGHLGFTGVSCWMDIDSGHTVVLLSNRVHPGRENTRIRAFRPRLHEAVVDGLRSDISLV